MDDFPTINRRKEYKFNRKIGMSIFNAAISAGYPRSLAEKHSKSVLLNTNHTPVDFVSLFERKRMTDIKKVEHALEGMQAVKIFVDKDGHEHTTPDWTARHKYFETMLRLCKQLEKQEGGNTTNILIQGSEFANRMKKARERASQELRAKFGKSVIDVTVNKVEEEFARAQ